MTFAHQNNPWLSQGLLRIPHHVTFLLLGYQESQSNDVFLGDFFALHSNHTVPLFYTGQSEITWHHVHNLFIFCDAENWCLNIVQVNFRFRLSFSLTYALSYLFLDFLHSWRFALNADLEVEDGLSETERVILYRNFLLLKRLFGNRHRQNVVRVKCDRNILADGALDARFKLSVEKLDKNALFTLMESVPVFGSHNLIRSPIRVLQVRIRFLAYSIHIFMHCFEEYGQHFLTIMLGKSLKLDCFPCNPAFDIPWSYIPSWTSIHIV